VKRAVVLCLIVAASLWPRPVAAQAVTGTILGSVTDTTGAAVPGATVTLTNLGTGLTRTVVTDSVGEYTAPSLPTGKYRLVSELPGFKTVTIPDIDLGVDQRVRINVQLQIGAVAENVTVAASSPLVQIASSELGTTVQEEQIKTLPLNGRNFVNLTRTVPGVVEPDEVDREAELGRHLVPQRGEMAGFEHQDALARRERVDERGFPGAGARGGIDHDGRAGLEHFFQPLEDLQPHGAEIGATVVHRSAVDRAQNAVGDVGRPRDLQEMASAPVGHDLLADR